MTGLDCLREEMKRRGCTKAQIESKATAIVLDILTEDKAKYAEQVDAEIANSIKLDGLLHEIYNAEREISRYKVTIGDLKIRYDGIVRQAEEAQEYIDKFNNALKECETAEGRDAMRRAQVFINSVNVDSKYDNTAYIIALGAILSDGAYGPIEELQKINSKIPVVEQQHKPKLKLRI